MGRRGAAELGRWAASLGGAQMSEVAGRRHERLLKRVEWLFPLRRRWLAYFLLAMLPVTWGLGMVLGLDRFQVRVYSANSPDRPEFSPAAPRHGVDCQFRMSTSFSGEVARTLRCGDLIIELAEGYGLGMRPTLYGRDCQ
jgi:hypothetical protein